MLPFDLVPAFLMAVLAAWLGLSLLARSPRDRAAQTFALLCLNLTVYGLAIAIGRISVAPDVRAIMHRIEIVETVILPPFWLLFINSVANTERLARTRSVLLIIFLLTGGALAAFALFSPQMDTRTIPPRFPTLLLIACSVAQRVVPLVLSLWLVVYSFLRAGEDRSEQGRRGFFALAVFIAVFGALIASAAREARFTQAPGHVLMDVGLAMMAYMVLAHRLLLPARVARRVFVRSLLSSGLTMLFIVAVLVFEPLVGALLGVETPLLTVFALVLLIAIFGPLRDAAGTWLDARLFHREFDYGRLLRAVSDDLFERGDLAGQLEAGLSAICRTLEARSGFVVVREGSEIHVLALYGAPSLDVAALRTHKLPDKLETPNNWQPWPDAQLLLPLCQGQQTLGLLVLGSKRSSEDYGEVERVLLDSLGRYLALAIVHARSQQQEEQAMAVLATQSEQLKAEQAQLEVLAADARRLLAEAKSAPTLAAPQETGLRVAVLGPLKVERDGRQITRWGGDKAGNYQSEALFAFLFDRRGKGLTKDEAEEVIWPDLDMDKADTAFHRTLGALRRTLEPGLRRGNESKAITYHHERYWLDPAIIGWCDADDYARAAARGQTLLRQGDYTSACQQLALASTLYRGDYMDDCPFFGDSAEVEERREQLREQHVLALLGLGAAYEQLGFVGEAAEAYRAALATSQDDCPRAEEAIQRLGYR